MDSEGSLEEDYEGMIDEFEYLQFNWDDDSIFDYIDNQSEIKIDNKPFNEIIVKLKKKSFGPKPHQAPGRSELFDLLLQNNVFIKRISAENPMNEKFVEEAGFNNFMKVPFLQKLFEKDIKHIRNEENSINNRAASITDINYIARKLIPNLKKKLSEKNFETDIYTIECLTNDKNNDFDEKLKAIVKDSWEIAERHKPHFKESKESTGKYQNLKFFLIEKFSCSCFNPLKNEYFKIWPLNKEKVKKLMFNRFCAAQNDSDGCQLNLYARFDTTDYLRIEIDLKKLSKICFRDNHVFLISSYVMPFKFYVTTSNIISFEINESSLWNPAFIKQDKWNRIQILGYDDKCDEKNCFLLNNYTLQLSFCKSSNFQDYFLKIIEKSNILNKLYSKELGEKIQKISNDNFLQVYEKLKTIKSWECRYALDTLHSQNKIILTERLVDTIINYINQGKEYEDALKWALREMDEKSVFNIPEDEEKFLKDLDYRVKVNKIKKKDNEIESIKKNYMSRHKKINITPSRVIYYNDELELNSTIARNCPEIKDRLIRVKILDDDFSGSFSSSMEKLIHNIIKERIKDLNIFGVQFKFLGYSSSQLRSNSFWALKIDKEYTRETFMKKFQDLKSEKIIAKYASRVGLVFASTVPLFDCKEEAKIEQIPDVEVKKYNFSDGIGTISKDLIEKISKKMRIRAPEMLCALQIRIGGIKGVLSKLETLPEKTINIRKSMKKYDFEVKELAVLNINQFRFGFLNRQIIMLLLTLGVPKEGFKELYDKYTEMIDKFEFGSSGPIFDFGDEQWLCKLDRYVPFYLDYHSRVSKNQNDPFIEGIIKSYKSKAYHALFTKTNIIVPKSVRLIGILDEYEVLNEDEIFVQVNRKYNEKNNSFEVISDPNNYIVIKGNVIITKNPCLHPGDIRKVNAVDNETLKKNYLNCVVFPKKGKIPLTHQIAGGDLDGDLYFVSWDERIIPPKVAEPFEYMVDVPKKYTENKEGVTEHEMIDFFCEFITNNVLGRIDNAHLAISEMSPELSNCENALILSEYHAQAVDYAKSGFTPNLDEINDILKNVKYPPYLKETSTFQGKTIIDKLWNETKLKLEEFNQVPAKLSLDETFQGTQKVVPAFQEKFIVKNWENCIDECQQCLMIFLHNFEHLKQLFGISNSFELVSGNYFKFQKKNMPNDKKNLQIKEKNILMNLNELYGELKKKFFYKSKRDNEKKSSEEKKSSKEKKSSEEIIQFTSCLYIMTYCLYYEFNNHKYNGIDYNKTGTFKQFNFMDQNNLKKLKEKIAEMLIKITEKSTFPIIDEAHKKSSKEIKTIPFNILAPWFIGSKQLKILWEA